MQGHSKSLIFKLKAVFTGESLVGKLPNWMLFFTGKSSVQTPPDYYTTTTRVNDRCLDFGKRSTVPRKSLISLTSSKSFH